MKLKLLYSLLRKKSLHGSKKVSVNQIRADLRFLNIFLDIPVFTLKFSKILIILNII